MLVVTVTMFAQQTSLPWQSVSSSHASAALLTAVQPLDATHDSLDHDVMPQQTCDFGSQLSLPHSMLALAASKGTASGLCTSVTLASFDDTSSLASVPPSADTNTSDEHAVIKPTAESTTRIRILSI